MTIIEFIFLILSVISLIDYIRYSIIIYKNKELLFLCGIKSEMIIRRYIEIFIIIITIAIFTYKFIY